MGFERNQNIKKNLQIGIESKFEEYKKYDPPKDGRLYELAIIREGVALAKCVSNYPDKLIWRYRNSGSGLMLISEDYSCRKFDNIFEFDEFIKRKYGNDYKNPYIDRNY